MLKQEAWVNILNIEKEIKWKEGLEKKKERRKEAVKMERSSFVEDKGGNSINTEFLFLSRCNVPVDY